MQEVLTCPHCQASITSSRTHNLPDSYVASCKKCSNKFTLGLARSPHQKQQLQVVQETATQPAAPVPSAPVPPTPIIMQAPPTPAPAPAPAVTNVHVHQHAAPVSTRSDGLAAVLSFLIPGLGHLYKGRILGGLIWFFLTGVGYVAFIIPGLILHLLCILRSASIRGK